MVYFYLIFVGCALDLVQADGIEEYTPLMNKFHLISNAVIGLSTGYQEVVSEIAQQMGEGVLKYLTAQIDSRAHYNEYCHFTAGLMGLGLTRLLYTAGVEQFSPDYLSNAMGLVWQKTNLTRDYLEQMNCEPKPKRHWHEKFGSSLLTSLRYN